MNAKTFFKKTTGTRIDFVLPEAHLGGRPVPPCFFFLESFIFACLLIFFVFVVKPFFL
jgi:hypothetical protein